MPKRYINKKFGEYLTKHCDVDGIALFNDFVENADKVVATKRPSRKSVVVSETDSESDTESESDEYNFTLLGYLPFTLEEIEQLFGNKTIAKPNDDPEFDFELRWDITFKGTNAVIFTFKDVRGIRIMAAKEIDLIEVVEYYENILDSSKPEPVKSEPEPVKVVKKPEPVKVVKKPEPVDLETESEASEESESENKPMKRRTLRYSSASEEEEYVR
jgi:hypothetical protein